MADGVVDLTEDEDLDLDAVEDEGEEPDNAAPEGEEDEEEGGEPAPEESDEEDVISFGGSEIESGDESEGMRNIRARLREVERENKQLKAASAPKPVDIGTKPNMDDYWEKDDPAGEFERDLLAWNERKRNASESEQRDKERAELAQREWAADVAELETQQASLRVRDYDAANDAVNQKLDDAQCAILVQVAKNKAALIYALGKDSARLEALAKQKNYAKFAGEVARLDMETKVSRKPTTKPEGAVRGAGSFNSKATSDAKLARLEAEADKTGNRTAVIAYRKQLKAAGRG